MAFTNEEVRHLSSVMDSYIAAKGPDDEFQDRISHHWRFGAQSIEVYETYRDSSGKVLETSIAKTRYVRSDDRWHVYWMRADEKWHSYEPNPVVGTVRDFLHLLDRDEHNCFWG